MYSTDLSLKPLKYGGVFEFNKKSQANQNKQIRQMIKELQQNPTRDKLEQTYSFILGSLLDQNNALLKDTFNRFKEKQYKKSNPTLTRYELDLISDELYKAYKIRQSFTNERLKDLVKKDYNTQLALFMGLMIGNRDKQKTIKDSVIDLQSRADDMLNDDMHRLRSELNYITAKEYGAIGYVWQNQQDNRVVGNPLGIYPVVKNPMVHGNHWDRQDKFYLYDFTDKETIKELKKQGVAFEFDKDLLDGSAGEPYGCRCFKINIYEIKELSKF